MKRRNDILERIAQLELEATLTRLPEESEQLLTDTIRRNPALAYIQALNWVLDEMHKPEPINRPECPDCGTALREMAGAFVCPVALEAKRRGILGQPGRHHQFVWMWEEMKQNGTRYPVVNVNDGEPASAKSRPGFQTRRWRDLKNAA